MAQAVDPLAGRGAERHPVTDGSEAGLTLALYQPDIPQNAGTLLRTCACLGGTAPRPRLVLLTTAGATDYRDVAYRPGDILMVGRETAGVPEEVHRAADVRVLVPMKPGMRSLNVAIAAAVVLGEALRQNRR